MLNLMLQHECFLLAVDKQLLPVPLAPPGKRMAVLKLASLLLSKVSFVDSFAWNKRGGEAGLTIPEANWFGAVAFLESIWVVQRLCRYQSCQYLKFSARKRIFHFSTLFSRCLRNSFQFLSMVFLGLLWLTGNRLFFVGLSSLWSQKIKMAAARVGSKLYSILCAFIKKVGLCMCLRGCYLDFSFHHILRSPLHLLCTFPSLKSLSQFEKSATTGCLPFNLPLQFNWRKAGDYWRDHDMVKSSLHIRLGPLEMKTVQ